MSKYFAMGDPSKRFLNARWAGETFFFWQQIPECFQSVTFSTLIALYNMSSGKIWETLIYKSHKPVPSLCGDKNKTQGWFQGRNPNS